MGSPAHRKHSFLFEMLGEVLNIYHASTIKNDCKGVHDHYDLWLFDEFHVAEDEGMQAGLGKAIMAVANNT